MGVRLWQKIMKSNSNGRKYQASQTPLNSKKSQKIKYSSTQNKGKDKAFLKEKHRKKYPFLDSNVAIMLEELVKFKLI